ncbi:MAG: 1-acyl-sn-glycerol-3-phosphate acyltransferase [Clostridia bacterium]|nr:1-acyl-sn-glycerol-3-phosphate acyltransferase [Clostridia bacterium]
MKSKLLKPVQWLLRGLVLILFRPRKTYVSEKARQEAFSEPCVIISNHVRGFDGAVIFTLLPGKRITGLVAQDMLENSKPLRWLCACLPVMRIDREHASLSWLRDSRRLLKEGQSIYLCPEGRCNFNRGMRPFKPGFALLAASAGVKVVPVFHNGEYYPLFGKRFRMLIGEPFTVAPPPEGLSAEVLAMEAGEAFDSMRELERRLNGAVRLMEGSGEK